MTHSITKDPADFKMLEKGLSSIIVLNTKRGIRPGDIVVFQEIEPEGKKFTRKELTVTIKTLFTNESEKGLKEGYAWIHFTHHAGEPQVPAGDAQDYEA